MHDFEKFMKPQFPGINLNENVKNYAPSAKDLQITYAL